MSGARTVVRRVSNLSPSSKDDHDGQPAGPVVRTLHDRGDPLLEPTVRGAQRTVMGVLQRSSISIPTVGRVPAVMWSCRARRCWCRRAHRNVDSFALLTGSAKCAQGLCFTAEVPLDVVAWAGLLAANVQISVALDNLTGQCFTAWNEYPYYRYALLPAGARCEEPLRLIVPITVDRSDTRLSVYMPPSEGRLPRVIPMTTDPPPCSTPAERLVRIAERCADCGIVGYSAETSRRNGAGPNGSALQRFILDTDGGWSFRDRDRLPFVPGQGPVVDVAVGGG